MGLGSYLGGIFFDWSGSYVASFALAATAGVINLAILTCLFVRLRPLDLACRCPPSVDDDHPR